MGGYHDVRWKPKPYTIVALILLLTAKFFIIQTKSADCLIKKTTLSTETSQPFVRHNNEINCFIKASLTRMG